MTMMILYNIAHGHCQTLASEIVRWTGLWDPLCETTPGSRHLFSFQHYSKARPGWKYQTYKEEDKTSCDCVVFSPAISRPVWQLFLEDLRHTVVPQVLWEAVCWNNESLIILKLHDSHQSCISSLAAIVDKPPSWRSMSATVIPAFPHWPNSGQCWEILWKQDVQNLMFDP